MTGFAGTPADRARELIVFCDGVEDAGLEHVARRGRVVARDLLAALAELEAERSARRAMQEARNRLQEIVGKAVYRDLVEREVEQERRRG